jgi:hypothetical protein
VFSDFNISELREVTQRKFPQKAEAVDALLRNLSYDTVRTPISPDKRIEDPKDYAGYPVEQIPARLKESLEKTAPPEFAHRNMYVTANVLVRY